MVGQVCLTTGEAKNTYGTGNFLLLNTGRELVRSEHGLLTTVCYQLGTAPPIYALEGSIAVTGSAIQWLRDQLGIINNAREIEALAASVDDTGGAYFVPAFSGLFAPHWRSDARGAIVGLSRFHTKAHLARAALEAICYQSRDVARGDGVRRRHRDWTCSRSTAGSPPTRSACRSRPTCSGSRSASRWSPRPPRWAPRTPRAWPAGSGTRRTSCGRTGTRTGGGPRRSARTSGRPGYAGWQKAVQRTLDWVEV